MFTVWTIGLIKLKKYCCKLLLTLSSVVAVGKLADRPLQAVPDMGRNYMPQRDRYMVLGCTAPQHRSLVADCRLGLDSSYLSEIELSGKNIKMK